MPEDLTKCQDSSHQQHCGLGRYNPTPGAGQNNPTLAGGSQTLFPAASGVSFSSEINCIGRWKSGEKGVPVAGGVSYFPQRRHQPPNRALSRRAALNSERAAPKPQGQAQALQPGMGSVLLVLHPSLTSNRLRLFPNTE